MLALKQSTSINIKLGPFLDKTDGVTEEIALTPVVEVSKNGAAFGARSGTTVSHNEDGYYLIQLNATDTGTLGRLRVKSHDSATYLPVWQEYMIMPANVWDSLFGADKLQVDLTQMGGVAQSATDLKHFADIGYDPGTSKVEGVKTADTVTTLTGHTPQTADHTAGIAAIPTVMRGTDGAATAAALTTHDNKIGTPVGADMSADIAAIPTTSMRGTDGASTFNPTAQTVDVGKVAGSALAATNLGVSAAAIVVGAAVAGTLSTTEMTTDLVEATNEHYKGRIIIWTSGLLKNQTTEITGYIGGSKKLVYTAVTEAPVSSDTFIVV